MKALTGYSHLRFMFSSVSFVCSPEIKTRNDESGLLRHPPYFRYVEWFQFFITLVVMGYLLFSDVILIVTDYLSFKSKNIRAGIS
jgi:hypothetical protein